MGKTDKNNLGQYFTPLNIAEYMSNELEENIPNNGNVLDPCIGKNIFFKTFKAGNLKLTGVEIDKQLINKNIIDFYSFPNRKLILGDFISQSFKVKFNAVIMNPPYTRQEKVSNKTKQLLKQLSDDAEINISSQANLYVYFLLKGLTLLKKDGILIAITYDSWLYSAFGENLKKYLLSKYNVRKIIHFKHDAFEDVDVGATIIEIENRKSQSNIKYIEIKSAKNFTLTNVDLNEYLLTPTELINFDEHTTLIEKLELPEKYFVELAILSTKKPWRGTSSPSNKYFVNNKYEEGFSPILKKTPKESYAVEIEDASYALIVTEANLKSMSAKLSVIKKNIIENESSASLINKINSNKWYSFPYKDGGEIIFNYYFRDNPRFIMNRSHIPTMGNYYNIKCEDNKYEVFALLNSSLTKYSLIKNSKSQGKGLRKIQLYKFNEIPILSIDYFNSDEKLELKSLGQKLANNQNIVKTLEDINYLVLNIYSKLIKTNYNEVKSIIDGALNL